MLLSNRALALRPAARGQAAGIISSSTSSTSTSNKSAVAARRRRSAPPARLAASSSEAATTAAAEAATTYTRATLRTTDACELAVSVYPYFSYRAAGGGGEASVSAAPAAAAAAPASPSPSAPPQKKNDDHLLALLTFDAAALEIPALDYRTAYLFGVLPIPPPLRIAIEPRELRGTLDPRTGACELAFDAEFRFTAGALYKAPPLRVQAVLTTGVSQGARLRGEGRAWDPSTSRVRLAGVSRVPKTGDAFLDAFLMLPNDALAVLEGELELR